MTRTENEQRTQTKFPVKPPLPPRAASRLGRPAGQSPDIIRQRILDSAEQLFAEFGYEGTSVRDIAGASQCQVQAIGHHFGLKDQLFDSVVMRRAAIMTEMRTQSLADEKARARGKSIALKRLVDAYVRPFILSAHDGNAGWRNYAVLMGRLANSPRGTEVIARHYDSTASDYLDEFAKALPQKPRADVVSGFMFMVASMLLICAKTGRSARLSASKKTVADAETDIATLVRFVVAGLRAI
jgi:AcrR family transcriptional regulator